MDVWPAKLHVQSYCLATHGIILTFLTAWLKPHTSMHYHKHWALQLSYAVKNVKYIRINIIITS